MPRLSELADLLVKCRVISRQQWDEAARIGRDDLPQILEQLTKSSPHWWENTPPAPPGLTEYQREAIQSRFADNELDLLRRDLVLNQFILLDRLGHGGQGQVYRSRQLNPPRYAAVKVLIRDTESRRKRFEQEARAMIRIQHPAVARFYLYERIRDSGGEPTDEYLIAMEFVNGTDLQRLVRKTGPIPWPFAVHWVCEMLSGLEVIHDNGFIHRDVKPENIMIVGPHPAAGLAWSETAAKLLDFGAVNRVDEPLEFNEAANRVFVGTMEYAAPEQWTGKIVVASDIYALGGSIFYMLTGRHVFKKDKRDPIAFMNAHLHETVPDITAFNQTIPPELNRLFLQMMSKDPAQRGTAAELLAEFEPMRPREATAAAAPPPSGPSFKAVRSKSTAVESTQPTEVVTTGKRTAVPAREAKVHNPLARTLDGILLMLESLFIPGHLRPPAEAELGIPERLLALLRRPLVLAILALFLLLVAFFVLR